MEETSDGSLPCIPYPTCSQRTKLPHTSFPKVSLLPSHLLVEASGKTRVLDRGQQE